MQTIGKALAAKILAVMEDVQNVEKDKRNDFHGYAYASDDAVLKKLRASFIKNRLIATPTQKSCALTPQKDMKGADVTFALIEVEYTLTDVDSGESHPYTFFGAGRDKEEKGVYKATTGAEKYFFLKAFMIPTGDDPETPEKTEARRPQEQKPSPRQPEPARAAAPAKPETSKPELAPCDKVITEAEAATLLNEAKLRRVDGLQFLAECKRHRAGLTKFTQLPATAYTAVYEFILKHDMPPAQNEVEVEIAKLGALGVPREQVLIYIKTLPFAATADTILKTLKSEREGFKIDVLRKRFADIAERAKREGAAA